MAEVVVSNGYRYSTGFLGDHFGFVVKEQELSDGFALTFSNGYTTTLRLDTPWSAMTTVEAMSRANIDHVEIANASKALLLITGFDISVPEFLTASTTTDQIALYRAELAGADHVTASWAADAIETFGGNDFVDAGAGADLVDGGSGNDVLLGGEGNDALIGGEGSDDLRGGSGDDSLTAGAGRDTLDGGEGADRLFGGNAGNRLSGGGGNDTIFAGTCGDVVSGGAGIDTVIFDTVLGGVTVDLARTTQQATGGSGLDSYADIENLTGSRYADELLGNADANRIDGRGGDDRLVGNAGNDTLVGGDGADTLTGGAGADSLEGGAGTDRLEGSRGADVLAGGAGRDVFVLSGGYWASERDTIVDFRPLDDTIGLDRASFQRLQVGALTGVAFNTGPAARDATDRIIYDPSTGALIFDSNGSAAGGAMQVATLSKGLVLTADDFVVI